MKRYLLDSNIWIYAMKGRHPLVRKTLEAQAVANVHLSTVVMGELAFGWASSKKPRETQRQVQEFLAPFPRLGVDDAVAEAYGNLRQILQSKGQPIGMNDFWIAAQALTHKLILVTNNTREFSRVPQLKLENWLS